MFIYRSTVIKDNFKEKKKRKEGRERGRGEGGRKTVREGKMSEGTSPPPKDALLNKYIKKMNQ